MHPDFEVFEEWGQGRVGTTRRGLDLNTDVPVAIKAIHSQVQDQWDRSGGWDRPREIAAATADHPGFVAIRQVDPQRGWIISDWMPGWVMADVRSSPRVVASILRQTLDTLDFLHEQGGWLHGAIHPRNLMIDTEGRIRLADIGGIPIATDLDPWVRSALLGHNAISHAGEFAETASPEQRRRPASKYLAPELISSKRVPIGPPADLYMLGMVVYDLLVGGRFDNLVPGVGRDAVNRDDAWWRWHIDSGRSLPPIESVVRDVPADLARLVNRMVAKEPRDRPSDARDALRELGSLGSFVRIRVRSLSQPGLGPASPGPGPVNAGGGPTSPPSRRPIPTQIETGPVVRKIGLSNPSPAGEPLPPLGPTLRGWIASTLPAVLGRTWVRLAIAAMVVLLVLRGLLSWEASASHEVVFEVDPPSSRPTLSLTFLGGEANPKTTPDEPIVLVEHKPFSDLGKISLDLAPGTYRAQIAAPGYETRQFDSLRIAAGRPSSFHLNLARKHRRVEFIRVEPAETRSACTVWRQGQSTPLDQVELPVEERVALTFTAEGFEDRTIALDVPEAGAGTYRFPEEIRLTPLPAAPVKLIVDVRPTVARPRILVDGQELPATVFERPPGLYQLDVQAEGYQPHRETLTVRPTPSGVHPIAIELVPVPRQRSVRFQFDAATRVSVRRHGQTDQAVVPGMLESHAIGDHLVVRACHAGLRWDQHDVLVVEGDGPQEVTIPSANPAEITLAEFDLKFVALNPTGQPGPFFTGIDWDVLHQVYPQPDDRAEPAAPADRPGATLGLGAIGSGLDPTNMRNPQNPFWSGDRLVADSPASLSWDELLVTSRFFDHLAEGRRFARRQGQGRRDFEARIAKGPALISRMPTSFFSSLPVTWSLWIEVMGRENLPREFLGRPNTPKDQPAVGIDAEAAEEFCRRLTRRLTESRQIEPDWGWAVTLPTFEEVVYAEKAGLSRYQIAPKPIAPRATAGNPDDQRRHLQRAATNVEVVRDNIRQMSIQIRTAARAACSVQALRPNELGIGLGLVSTWTSDPGSKPRHHWAAGPNYRTQSDLGHYVPWVSDQFRPGEFGIRDDLPSYFVFDEKGYWPGLSRDLDPQFRSGDLGLYLTLRRPPGDPSTPRVGVVTGSRRPVFGGSQPLPEGE